MLRSDRCSRGVLLGLIGMILNTTVFAAGIDPANPYAWAENAGWLNFRASGGHVQVYADHLEGDVWAENIGWIRLGAHTAGGTHTYANTSPSTYGVNRSGATLSGYAWAENAGWINFAPTGGGVTLNAATGAFDGYAWGENIGWIKFAGTAQNSMAYRVAVQTYTVTPSAGNGGTVNPDTAQTVFQGATLPFTVTPATHYTVNNTITGDCPAGSWNGNVYITGAITANCAVGFSFSNMPSNGACDSANGQTSTSAPASNLCSVGSASTVISNAGNFTWTCVGSHGGTTASCSASRAYTVTPAAGANGSLTPNTPQTVAYNQTTAFTVTPNTGYQIDTVTGCNGALSSAAYTTGAITGACAVTANFRVSKATPTVTLSAAPTAPAMNQLTTITATVTAPSGTTGTPTGTVAISGGGQSCTATLTSGRSSCALTYSSFGNVTLNGTYSGDANFTAASGALLLSVGQIPTTTLLTSAPNPSIPGQSVTLTATVSSASGSPTGTVAFADHRTAFPGCASIAVNAGAASCLTATLTAGNHPLTAQYSGDATFAASRGSHTQTVNAASARLVNLSSRGWVGTGDALLIDGFILGGSPTPRPVIVRALGPTLTNAGLAAPLANPRLRVTTVTGEPIADNDDWGQAANAADLQALGYAPAHPQEAALLLTLHPDVPYTVLVDGVDAGTGLALVEILDPHRTIAVNSRLINLSSRGWVGRDDDLLIGGLILDGGDAPRRVLVRVLGPTLAEAQLGDPLLENPRLTLTTLDGQVLAENDDWAQSPEAAAIQATGLAPPDPQEPALLLTLDPRTPYTALVHGVNDTTGLVLLEILELP